MNETLAILTAIDHLHRAGESAALATVVRVQGSAYRRPGARMLIGPGASHRIGSVSGGCLEGDVARKAWQLTENGAAALLRYDSSAEDDGLWGLGLGCNGVVEILVERMAPDNSLPAFLRRCIDYRRAGVVATVFSADEGTDIRIGARVLVNDDSTIESDDEQIADALPDLLDDARHCLESLTTAVATYELATGKIDVLLEVIEPPLALVIFGAGWDVIPLVQAAKALGWHVTVTDRRAAFANPEKFPLADRCVACPPDQARRHLSFDARTAAVLMTHQYPDDLAYLPTALASDAFYVGLLGPTRRRDRLITDLAEVEQFTPTADLLDRLHAPIGLDIGAENAAQIAASITAEILAVSNKRPAGQLRERQAPIHHPVVQIQSQPS